MAHSNGTWKRLGTGSLLTQDADEGLGHVLPVNTYIRTFAALLVLTFVTVWAAQIDFGKANILIAILIASVKAALVMSFFMHLRFEARLVLFYALYPFVVLSILIGGSLLEDLERPEVRPIGFKQTTEQL